MAAEHRIDPPGTSPTTKSTPSEATSNAALLAAPSGEIFCLEACRGGPRHGQIVPVPLDLLQVLKQKLRRLKISHVAGDAPPHEIRQRPRCPREGCGLRVDGLSPEGEVAFPETRTGLESGRPICRGLARGQSSVELLDDRRFPQPDGASRETQTGPAACTRSTRPTRASTSFARESPKNPLVIPEGSFTQLLFVHGARLPRRPGLTRRL